MLIIKILKCGKTCNNVINVKLMNLNFLFYVLIRRRKHIQVWCFIEHLFDFVYIIGDAYNGLGELY